MKNSIHEYSALREELVQLIGLQTELILSMYTISIAILGFAFERNNTYLLYLVYLAVIPFQINLNRRYINMFRLSAYIAVFFGKEAGFHYESDWRTIRHIYDSNGLSGKTRRTWKRYLLSRVSGLSDNIARSGSVVLTLCTFSVLIYRAIYKTESFKIKIILLVSSVILQLLVFAFSRPMFRLDKIYKGYLEASKKYARELLRAEEMLNPERRKNKDTRRKDLRHSGPQAARRRGYAYLRLPDGKAQKNRQTARGHKVRRGGAEGAGRSRRARRRGNPSR